MQMGMKVCTGDPGWLVTGRDSSTLMPRPGAASRGCGPEKEEEEEEEGEEGS